MAVSRTRRGRPMSGSPRTRPCGSADPRHRLLRGPLGRRGRRRRRGGRRGRASRCCCSAAARTSSSPTRGCRDGGADRLARRAHRPPRRRVRAGHRRGGGGLGRRRRDAVSTTGSAGWSACPASPGAAARRRCRTSARTAWRSPTCSSTSTSTTGAPARCASTCPAAELGLGYRTSVLKGRDDAIVLRVRFALTGDGLVRADPLRRARPRASTWPPGERVPGRAAREAVLELRRGKGMVLDADDHDTWSAGSFFTNPIVAGRGRAAAWRVSPRWPAGDGTGQAVRGGADPGVRFRPRPRGARRAGRAVVAACARAHQPGRGHARPTCWRWPARSATASRSRTGVDAARRAGAGGLRDLKRAYPRKAPALLRCDAYRRTRSPGEPGQPPARSPVRMGGARTTRRERDATAADHRGVADRRSGRGHRGGHGGRRGPAWTVWRPLRRRRT